MDETRKRPGLSPAQLAEGEKWVHRLETARTEEQYALSGRNQWIKKMIAGEFAFPTEIGRVVKLRREVVHEIATEEEG